MKTLKIVACQRNTDQTEGRGRMEDVCYATSKDLALRIVNHPTYYGTYGVMGCKPYKGGEYDISEKEMVIFETMEEYLETLKNKKVKTALDKLTDEEKELLGLK
jgi:hypothetical protein